MALSIWVSLVLGAATGGVAAKPPPARVSKPRLAVMDIQSLVGVTPELAHGLTAALVVAVRRAAPDYSVISTEEVKAMLAAERTKQELGCAEAACLAEIGGALGATELLAGQLGKFGGTYLLTLKLLDVRKATVEKEAAESIQGQGDDALLGAVKRVTRKLFPATFNSDDELDVNAADLWGSAPPPAGGNHVAGWLLLAGAGATAALAIASFLQVASYNSNVDSWNAALHPNRGSGTLPGSLTAQSANQQRNAANVWQGVGFGAVGASALASAGAVLVW